MIPFIRSISELMAITEPREHNKDHTNENKRDHMRMSSIQRKECISNIEKDEVNLPFLPKTIRCKWVGNKEKVSKFFDELDYNNQIQSSYDLTLLERQNKRNQQDVA